MSEDFYLYEQNVQLMRATIQIAIFTIVVFMIQMALMFFDTATQSLFALTLPLEENLWTVFLNVYSHGGYGHLLSNLVALLIIGILVERITTPMRFHIFFIGTGVLAAIAEVTFWLLFTGEIIAVLGASGGIFALMGYALIGNQAIGSVMDKIDLGKYATIGIFALIAIGVTIATAGEGVALIAHATGFFLGALAGHVRILHTN